MTEWMADSVSLNDCFIAWLIDSSLDYFIEWLVNSQAINYWTINIASLKYIHLGTWHQYDDAIFSQPGLWESFRSLFPHYENDPAEGRRLAMIAMLPDWESISLKQGGMNAHDALSKINNVIHCMSKAEVENGGLFLLRVPYGFNILEVCTRKLFVY